VEESTNAHDGAPDGEDGGAVAPEVTHVLHGDTVRVTVVGELTDAARRPLVRTLTDLLLTESTLHRVELHLAGVTFINSAGIAVLVQLERMVKPRGIDLVLVRPPVAVARSLRSTGLWHRFTVVDSPGGDAEDDAGVR
jgi:stage II sporulation protein AA (anti-sigma F factor antagonist)